MKSSFGEKGLTGWRLGREGVEARDAETQTDRERERSSGADWYKCLCWEIGEIFFALSHFLPFRAYNFKLARFSECGALDALLQKLPARHTVGNGARLHYCIP